MQAERVDELGELPLHHRIQLVQGQVDAMVRRPVLRKIVRADLLRPVPGSDLALARLRAFGVLALLLRLVQARPEYAQGLGLVLVLALLVLAVQKICGDVNGRLTGSVPQRDNPSV